MIIGIKVVTKSFKGSNIKEAYKRTIKYIYDNNRDTLTFRVEEDKLNNQCLLHIFATNESSEEISHFCKMCKTLHKSFFINEEYNCHRCNLKAFIKRNNEKLRIKKGYHQEKLNL